MKRSDQPLFIELTAPNGRQYSQPVGLFIDNQWKASSDGEKMVTIDPATEQEITSVYLATEEDVDTAVHAARTAFSGDAWRNMDGTERRRLMMCLADLVDEHKDILATIETWDNGKPYNASLNQDLVEVSETLRYYAGFADKMSGQTIETTRDKMAYTIREPVGVCGMIIPWNYPLVMAAWKLGPALACGNTVVLKAAEQTPLSILYFATLVASAGFPAGVINIINGLGAVAGAAIASHALVDKIAFTGSTITGQQVMKLASSNLKAITLETGGKSPLIVFEDADVSLAAKWAHLGIMSNQGQICTATSRILVHEKIFAEFMTAFRKQVLDVKVGDPFSEDTFQGPQITRHRYERLLSYVDIGKAEGAHLEMGGKPAIVGTKSTMYNRRQETPKGFYIEPTVFSGVDPSMRIFREEIFGPFAVVTCFSSEASAVRLANDSIYGLGSALFTSNLTRAHRVARQIEAGMVWINSSNRLEGSIRWR